MNGNNWQQFFYWLCAMCFPWKIITKKLLLADDRNFLAEKTINMYTHLSLHEPAEKYSIFHENLKI